MYIVEKILSLIDIFLTRVKSCYGGLKSSLNFLYMDSGERALTNRIFMLVQLSLPDRISRARTLSTYTNSQDK